MTHNNVNGPTTMPLVRCSIKHGSSMRDLYVWRRVSQGISIAYHEEVNCCEGRKVEGGREVHQAYVHTRIRPGSGTWDMGYETWDIELGTWAFKQS